jgi:aryl-alcohol dehydrogenase-like predicted oxidoreductase
VLRRHADRPLAVVSKLDAEVPADDPEAVHEAVWRSARRIGRPLAGMLIHDPSQLDAWAGGLGATLAGCRDAGLTERVGVSVYTPEQFALALELEELSIVQAPYSVFDRRLDEAGLLIRARERGIVVMLRSAFLQGLLVMDPARRPGWLSFAAERLRAWDECCARAGLPPAQVALRFVLDHHPDALVPVGCETSAQLDGIIAAALAPALEPTLVDELEALASDDLALVDPTRWPATA